MATLSVDPAPRTLHIHASGLRSQLDAARAEVAQLRTQLEVLRDQDPLTGLPNRIRLADRTGQALLLAERQGSMVALLFIELDRFKALTQTLEFKEADELIHQLTRRISAMLSPADTLARVASDQFAILLPEVRDPGEPMRLAQGILEALGIPYRLGHREAVLTASIGISLSPQDADEADALQKAAENAALRARNSGGNAIQATTLTLSEAFFERQRLESDLGQAIQRNELQLLYQPQVGPDGAIVGVEALLRWHHPVLGPVPPSKFIPLAEENRFIQPLGEWILSTACRQAATWQAMSPRPVKMAVNVSSLQVGTPRWLDFVAHTLRETRLSPACLELEITESALLKNPRPGRTPLHDLKALGISLGIDDFGTGYSSLSYLQRFPIDTLKIDQAFVNGMYPVAPGAVSSLPIVQTIMDLGKNLGMTIVAEGVETPAQQRTLTEMGCRVFQGYLTGKPMEASHLTILLETQIISAFNALLPPRR